MRLVSIRMFVRRVGRGAVGVVVPESAGEERSNHCGLADDYCNDIFSTRPDSCGFAFLELLMRQF
jgi:hypothetical protein